MNLDVRERQDLRELISTARSSMDYTSHLWVALADVLDEFELAIDILRSCVSDGGAISFPLYDEIERFVEKHTL